MSSTTCSRGGAIQILAKTPGYYPLRENNGDYHKLFPSRMSVQSAALSSSGLLRAVRRGGGERRRRGGVYGY